jgi:hypothetical protein
MTADQMDLIKREPHCVFCHKSGILTAIENKTKLNYAFRCTFCKCAEIIGLAKDFVYWRAELLKSFSLVK